MPGEGQAGLPTGVAEDPQSGLESGARSATQASDGDGGRTQGADSESVQKRIDQLTAKAHYWREQAEALQGQMSQLQASTSAIEAAVTQQQKAGKEPESVRDLSRMDREKLVEAMLEGKDPKARADARHFFLDLLETTADEKVESYKRQQEEALQKAQRLEALRIRVGQQVLDTFGDRVNDPRNPLRQEAEKVFAELRKVHGDDLEERFPDAHLLAYFQAFSRMEGGGKPLPFVVQDLRRTVQQERLADGVEGAGGTAGTEPSPVEGSLEKGDRRGALRHVVQQMRSQKG